MAPEEQQPAGASQQEQPEQGQPEQAPRQRRWRVATRHGPTRREELRSFDAVVVCNGHYSHPNLPVIAGMGEFPAGRQLHSHNYRAPEPFTGQVRGPKSKR